MSCCHCHPVRIAGDVLLSNEGKCVLEVYCNPENQVKDSDLIKVEEKLEAESQNFPKDPQKVPEFWQLYLSGEQSMSQVNS